jgi:hypothetical protein
MKKRHVYTPAEIAYLRQHWATKPMHEMLTYIGDGMTEKLLVRQVVRWRAKDSTFPYRKETARNGPRVAEHVTDKRKGNKSVSQGMQQRVFVGMKKEDLKNCKVYKKRSIEDKTKGKQRLIIPELKNMEVWYNPTITTAEAVRKRYIGQHRYELTGG